MLIRLCFTGKPALSGQSHFVIQTPEQINSYLKSNIILNPLFCVNKLHVHWKRSSLFQRKFSSSVHLTPKKSVKTLQCTPGHSTPLLQGNVIFNSDLGVSAWHLWCCDDPAHGCQSHYANRVSTQEAFQLCFSVFHLTHISQNGCAPISINLAVYTCRDTACIATALTVAESEADEYDNFCKFTSLSSSFFILHRTTFLTCHTMNALK